jgi:hypothetical protein
MSGPRNTEPQANGALARALRRRNPDWNDSTVHAERTHVIHQAVPGTGTGKIPDILVAPPRRQPVIVETEFAPARTVEQDATARLGTSLHSTGEDIEGVLSVVLPESLKTGDLETVDRAAFRYATHYLDAKGESIRWPPEREWLEGGVDSLADAIEWLSLSERQLARGTEALEQVVRNAAGLLAEHAGEGSLARVARDLHQGAGEQTERMAAAICVSAFVFHVAIEDQEHIPPVPLAGSIDRRTLVNTWNKILAVNYWPIFSVARDVVMDLPVRAVPPVMNRIAESISDLALLGATTFHDLTGRMFQTLITDRKFLATFYTRPEAAALLAHLAIPDDSGWGDPERVKDFRIADYACGTGTLIHAAYRRLNQLHWLAGGDPESLHAHMMENALTACDVLPSSVHLTASMLSSSHPRQSYDGSRTIVAQYGKTEHGGVSIGSLDLLGKTGKFRPLIPMHTATALTGRGETRSELDVDMPPFSQNLVIMNPPFTRAGSDWQINNPQGYDTKTFHGLSTDTATQKRMADLAKTYGKGTCAHGYAGIASWFVALAHRMVKEAGSIALVLPMTALQGATWQKARQLIANSYRDVTVLTIAAARQDDRSFSADTGMAETMIVCRKSSKAPERRGLFVSLRRRPGSEMEAIEVARAIRAIVEDSTVRTLEDGPFGGTPLFVGEERLGEVIDAPLSRDAPWSSVGISDFSVAQTAFQLAEGLLWLPQMSRGDVVPLLISTVSPEGELGKGDAVIVGRKGKAAFDMIRPPSNAPTYPMLWGHDAQREKRMVVAPDSEGRISAGMETLAAEIWDTRSHAHHNRDFRFNSQPLTVAFTETQTIGGRAWPNVKFEGRAHEVAYTLWGSSTLGLLCYWWHSSRQQAGRGSMPITAIRSMTTLDVTKLTQAQLDTAGEIFEDMKSSQFLPANEAYRDNTRKELDYRVLIDMLGLPERVLEPLDLLRLKWCSEPSVHGGKKTAPEG